MLYEVITLPRLADVTDGQIKFVIKAGDDIDKDVLSHVLVVHKVSHFDVGADYGILKDGSNKMPLQFPNDIRPDVGDVSVILSPTLIGDIEGAFEYSYNFV